MQDMRVPMLLLTGLLTAAACGGDDQNDDVDEAVAAQSAADSAAASSLLTPIRGMSMAEVEFADMAAQRAGSPAIRQYAQTVAADHRQLITALDSAARVHRAALTETRETQEMANTARLAHSGLEGLAGGAFDLPFVRAEVESHRMLLDQLDQQLIPAATNPELNGLLTDIRALADAHLTRARQLLAQQLGEAEPPQQPSSQQPQRRPPAGQPVPPPAR
jgi:putative membrane protein